MHIDELARAVNPQKTILFLGSGASVPCGGPTAPALAAGLWADLVGGDAASEDLAELSSIICNRVGRTRLVDALRKRLCSIEPTGPVRALMAYPWASVYSTNYDFVVERACASIAKKVAVVRSNFDYPQLEATDHMPLLKVHGCLSQDIVDGHNSRIIITDEDYDLTLHYRETLYRKLALELATRDVLLIGHSLRDPDIKKEVLRAAELKSQSGAPGRVFLTIYEADDDRARLYERKSVNVCGCSLEQLVEALTRASESLPASAIVAETTELLTPHQVACTLAVCEELRKPANAARLFHGSEATYADIEAGLTIQRSFEDRILGVLTNGDVRYAVITGVGGVGKTTLARRVMHRIAKLGFPAWEWRKEFGFRASEWILTDARLRESGRVGYLLVDECLPFLRHINDICARSSRHPAPGLKIVLTANHAQWVPRIKSPELFRYGTSCRISQLDDREIAELVELLDTKSEIRKHVPNQFTSLSRMSRIERLKRRCQADMFVCLKHIFSFQSLDQILLTEYANLDQTQQDVYRLVAFLEASCGLVHRQLILRLVEMAPAAVKQRLLELEDIIEEYDVDTSEGLYGWRTRHSVIAKTITQYKFAAEQEVFEMLGRVVGVVIPTVTMELRMLREMCSAEAGISQIHNPESRVNLLQRIIDIVPSERVPRHRLITTLIEMHRFDEAEAAIHDAIRVIRRDPPLQRYLVRLHVAKALNQDGLLREDRVALLKRAERMAQEAVERFPDDKRAYLSYADVGEALARIDGDRAVLYHAISEMQKAAERLLDPEFVESARGLARRHGG